MTIQKLFNLAKVSSSTTGTGDVTLGSAKTGFLSFADAGVSDGDVVSYGIKDGSNFEVGRGTYSSTGPKLARTTVLKSSNSNAALDLSGSDVEVFISPLAEDFDVTGNLAGGFWTSTDVAAAATCDIGAATTPLVKIAGTTTITSFGTKANRLRRVHFNGALTLTHNDTSLILPGSANITTAAGDEAEFVSDASGNWTCKRYQRASGLPLKPTLGTAAAKDVGFFATAAQGALADSAVQPGDLSEVATSGSYNDLTDTPSAGTGDVVGPSSATDAHIALFDTTTGKKIKDGGKGIPSGDIVGTSDTQTLTNKTVSLDDNTVKYTPSGTSAVARSVSGKIGETVSVTDFGAVQDSTTDCTAAFNAALATGCPVFVPDDGSGNYYVVSDGLVMASGQSFVGAGTRPKIKLDSASVGTLFDLDDLTGVTIRSLTLDGNKDTTPSSRFISMTNAVGCHIIDNTLINPPADAYGSIVCSGTATDNLIGWNDISGGEQSAIVFKDAGTTGNAAIENKITDCVAFGIRLDVGAHGNLVQSNKTQSNGLELVGLTYSAHDNRLIANHAENTGDAGISVTGYSNTVAQNVCIGNTGAGITIWGSSNTVVSNVCKNNNQQLLSGGGVGGITVFPAFGGTGQYNTIVGNFCDDDQDEPTQTHGVYIRDTSYYSAWVTGDTVAVGDFCKNGLNVYRASTAGTTGSTAPTHTTGSVSDGGVTWEYRNTFVDAVESRYNFVGFNSVPRFATAATGDAGGWVYNTRLQADELDIPNGKTSVINKSDNANIEVARYRGMRATPTSGDRLYQSFRLNNTAGSEIEFARINAQAITATSGSEAGALSIGLRNLGFLQTVLLFLPTLVAPLTDGGYDFGRSDLQFGNLFLKSGGALKFNAGADTVTHSSAGFTFSKPVIADGLERVLGKSAVTVTAPASSTSENTLATVSVPASALGTDGALEIEAWGTCTNGANTKTIRIKYGGTTFTSLAPTTGLSGEWYLKATVTNRHNAASQIGTGESNRVSDGVMQKIATTTGTVDSTSAQDVTITEQRTAGTDSVTLEKYVIRLVK